MPSLASTRAVAVRVAACLCLASLAYAGYREHWFLTDDAFITFRYASNHLRGWGYTWNPPPFRPVEGYTSFLWLVLLEGVWRVLAIEPPESANPIGFLLGLGTLGVEMLTIVGLPLSARLRPHRFWLACLAAVATLSNRTFLTWMSSGLETSLVVFLGAVWLLAALRLGSPHRLRWLFLLSLSASLAALARPDGTLWVLATALLHGWCLWEALFTGRPLWGRRLVSIVPLALVPAHVLWRKSYYGEWVPNTYFAKHVAPWPEAGIRYLAAYTIELGVWGFLALVFVAAWRAWALRGTWRESARLVPAAVATGVLLAYAAYYTLVIGGDHFEYRVYAPLVVPTSVATVALAASLALSPRATYGVVVAVILFSLPVEWTHRLATRDNTERHRGAWVVQRIALVFPALLRPYVDLFDDLEAWLIPHGVGVRQFEHKTYLEMQRDRWPTREVGSKFQWRDYPILFQNTVGVPGWTLPEVAIIDEYGLNDAVIARTPVTKDRAKDRRMAHDRSPPPGYVDCFDPNLAHGARSGEVTTRPHKQPMTDERIRRCEAWPIPKP